MNSFEEGFSRRLRAELDEVWVRAPVPLAHARQRRLGKWTGRTVAVALASVLALSAVSVAVGKGPGGWINDGARVLGLEPEEHASPSPHSSSSAEPTEGPEHVTPEPTEHSAKETGDAGDRDGSEPGSPEAGERENATESP